MIKWKKLWLWIPAALWMGVIFYLSSQTGPGGPEWQSIVGHIIEYSFLATLFWIALRGTTEANPKNLFFLAVGLSTLYGLSDEWHQSFTPGRVPDPFDVLVDFTAASAAAILLSFVYSSGE